MEGDKMENEHVPTQSKHVNRGMDLETKKAWLAPRIREIRTKGTQSQNGTGQDGGMGGEVSAS